MRNFYATYRVVFTTAAGIISQTLVLGIGGLAFWAVVGNNGGSVTLGHVATAVSLATIASMLAAAGALHLVIARKEHLRHLVSALAIVCTALATALGAVFASHYRLPVAILSGAIALGLVADAGAVADGKAKRVAVRSAMQVFGLLAAAVFLHTTTAFLLAECLAVAIPSLVQICHWWSRPQFRLLQHLGKDVWSYHIAGVAGQAPAFIVAPMAALLSTSVVAGQAYIAMALVGPLTSFSVALSVGVHADGKREADDTRRLYIRVVLAVLGLATFAALCTPLLRFAGPAFATDAPFVAVMVFATVFDAASNMWASVWRVQKRLVVVPLLYLAELSAFVVATGLTLHALGLPSVAWGWYAQGIAGVLVVLLVERRIVPRRVASAPAAPSLKEAAP